MFYVGRPQNENGESECFSFWFVLFTKITKMVCIISAKIPEKIKGFTISLPRHTNMPIFLKIITFFTFCFSILMTTSQLSFGIFFIQEENKHGSGRASLLIKSGKKI